MEEGERKRGKEREREEVDIRRVTDRQGEMERRRERVAVEGKDGRVALITLISKSRDL